ncbi:MAG: hypothetical protein IPF73_03660 [Betaproteobacteria bacterium]|nr:hypothetical protein [Betaproteobacteria bacterium]
MAIVTHDLHPYGAERVAVAIADSLRSAFGVRCEMASLGGGSLAVALRRSIPVHMLGVLWTAAQRDIAPVAHAMRARGYRHVILNTVLCGGTASVFRRMGYAVLGLVHEMPGLIPGRSGSKGGSRRCTNTRMRCTRTRRCSARSRRNSARCRARRR